MKSVLITGASTGIGRATALRMDAEGWRIFATVRREDDLKELRQVGSERLQPLLLDVTDPDQITATAERVSAEVGAGGLAGLVNNAGIAVMAPLETIPIEDLRHQLEVNLISQVAVTQAMLPLIRSARGRVVFLSSIGGRMALPFGAPYHASKYGIEAVTDCLRQELRPWGIEVIAIEPGSIDTPIWERGEKRADTAAEKAPPAQETLYGEQIESFRGAVRRTAERGIPPSKVADAIRHALTARRPRTRYLVGADARGQALLGRVLPSRLMDRIIARSMGL
ncbi:MAG TPA: SDR family NAD(P)-dependent oxidoreductase [Solirubrobacterales bacterium]|nr:SDR family NAD(P)-dependent oxidoreductase [Solirubrobacterales bacterium]